MVTRLMNGLTVRDRTPAGTPAGGQFALQARTEATLSLAEPTPDPQADLAAATTLAEAYCAAAGGARPGMCHAAAWNVRDQFGWPIVEGERDGMKHSWNQMPDGRWFDATAETFGEQGPQVVDAGDPRYTVRED